MVLDQTLNGIACAESPEFFSVNLTDADSTGTRRLFCNWADAVRMADWLRGSTVDAGGITVTSPKQSHPLVDWLYCDNVRISPNGKPTGMSTWEYATLDLSYRNLTNSFDPETLQDVTVEVGGEVVTLGKEGWKFDDEDESPVFIDPTKMVSTLTVSVTKYKLTTNPLGLMVSLLNKVNSGSFPILGYSMPQYQALYVGGSIQQRITTGNVRTFDATHKIVIGPYDMRSGNQINDVTGLYEPLKHKVSGDYLYDAESFNGLGII